MQKVGSGNVLLQAPVFEWTADAWEILFTAIPKSEALRGRTGVRPIGMTGPAQPSVVNRRAPLRRALDAKASAYGHLEWPYIIAVLIQEYWATNITIERVLYGELGSRLSPAQRRAAETDGFFFNSSSGGVSAVLAAPELAPWMVGRHAPGLWINPLADRALTSRLPWPEITIEVTAKREPLRIEMHDLYGLGPEWPGPEPPFQD